MNRKAETRQGRGRTELCKHRKVEVRGEDELLVSLKVPELTSTA